MDKEIGKVIVICGRILYNVKEFITVRPRAGR